jgi:hypothetical protein
MAAGPCFFAETRRYRWILAWWLALGSLVAAFSGCPAGGDGEWTPPAELVSRQAESGDRGGERSAESETELVSAEEFARVRGRVAEALAAAKGRRLSVETNAAWQILHGVLAVGRELPIEVGAKSERAVGYLMGGGSMKGLTLRGGDRFETLDGQTVRGIVAELEPGEKIGQGHRDQWLAYLSTACDLDASETIRMSNGDALTVEGWVRQAEWDVPLNFEREYSWTLMALIRHRPTDHQWVARDGESYSIESLLASEIGQLAPENACGGSHRLFAIAAALQARKDEGRPIEGAWSDAEGLVDLAVSQVREFRNADGSFSSKYFDRPGWSLDLAAALGTTGHAFEFVAMGGPEAALREAWMVEAADWLCETLERTEGLDLECGALYHALSGLAIYDRRTGGKPAIAKRDGRQRAAGNG